MCPNPILPNSGAVPIRPNPLLRQVVAGLRIDRVENQPSDRGPVVRCQLSGTPGRYERAAHRDAINVAHGVMRDALAQVSGGKAAALSRTLALMGPSTPQNLGTVLLTHLTAIGAMRAGVAALQTTAEGEPIDGRALLLKQLDDAIVNVGIKAGKCTMAEPDAVYDVTHSSSKEVCKAVASGKKVMLDCAVKMGAPELLAGVAQAVLPRSMQESLADRLPAVLNEARQSNSSPDIYNVLASNAATFVDEVLNVQLDTGDAGDLQASVFEVLKIPQYVLDRQRGNAAEPRPEEEAVQPREDSRRDDLPPSLRSREGLVNYNHAPVTVDSGIGKFVTSFDKLLENVRNQNDNFELGRRFGMLEEQLKTANQRIQDMEQRLRTFASANPNPSPSRADERELLFEAPFQGLGNGRDETDSSSRLPPDNGQRLPSQPTDDQPLRTAPINDRTETEIGETSPLDRGPVIENVQTTDTSGGHGNGGDRTNEEFVNVLTNEDADVAADELYQRPSRRSGTEAITNRRDDRSPPITSIGVHGEGLVYRRSPSHVNSNANGGAAPRLPELLHILDGIGGERLMPEDAVRLSREWQSQGGAPTAAQTPINPRPAAQRGRVINNTAVNPIPTVASSARPAPLLEVSRPARGSPFGLNYVELPRNPFPLTTAGGGSQDRQRRELLRAEHLFGSRNPASLRNGYQTWVDTVLALPTGPANVSEEARSGSRSPDGVPRPLPISAQSAITYENILAPRDVVIVPLSVDGSQDTNTPDSRIHSPVPENSNLDSGSLSINGRSAPPPSDTGFNSSRHERSVTTSRHSRFSPALEQLITRVLTTGPVRP